VTVAIAEDGSLDLPKLSVDFVPDSLSIERLTVEDGLVNVLNAATGGRTTSRPDASVMTGDCGCA
jgi:hypothetical protein